MPEMLMGGQCPRAAEHRDAHRLRGQPLYNPAPGLPDALGFLRQVAVAWSDLRHPGHLKTSMFIIVLRKARRFPLGVWVGMDIWCFGTLDSQAGEGPWAPAGAGTSGLASLSSACAPAKLSQQASAATQAGGRNRFCFLGYMTWVL